MFIKLQIDFLANKCHHWPYIKVQYNDILLTDRELDTKTSLIFTDLPIENSNTIKIIHPGKKRGENNIWDTKTNANGEIIEDCNFQITNFLINDVSLNETAYKKFLFNSTEKYADIYLNYLVGFNGEFNICFPKDIYSWLTVIKYKKDIVDKLEQFSNTSQLFHYEEDHKLVKEIKELLQLQ